MSEVTSPAKIADTLTEYWSPRIVGAVDDAYVKVAKGSGAFPWHSHDGEDELFFILKGSVRIELRDGAVVLNEGEMYVVPKGVEHRPVVEGECHFLLIERKTTQHTGNIKTDKTRSVEEQLGVLPE